MTRNFLDTAAAIPAAEAIHLPRLALTIGEMTGGPAPRYRALHLAICNGEIPAENRNGRWYVRRSDIPRVLRLFGLSLPNAAPASSAA